MAKKTWLVTCVPPKGRGQKLPLRPTTPKSELPEGQKESVQERSQVRNYHIVAETKAEAQSLIEEQERRALEQMVTLGYLEQDPQQLLEETEKEKIREKIRKANPVWPVDRVVQD